MFCMITDHLFIMIDGIFMFIEMGETDLERKISLGKELLAIAELLEPGQSVFRGKLLLDMIPALMQQTKRKVINRLINSQIASVKFIKI